MLWHTFWIAFWMNAWITFSIAFRMHIMTCILDCIPTEYYDVTCLISCDAYEHLTIDDDDDVNVECDDGSDVIM